MSRIMQLLKNLKYISKINLRKNQLVGMNAEDLLVNALYYVPNSSVLRPNVLDAVHTVDALCKTKKSLARFGDGEMLIINGENIPFQQYDERLAERLREILLNNNDKLMVGINYWYFYPVYDPCANDISRKFALFDMPQFRKDLMKHIDVSTNYCDAGFTGIRVEKNEQNDNIFRQIRTIWENSKVLVVGCREARVKMKFDLFDNAAQENWIYVPNKNAFNEYDKILTQIKKYPKDTIIILMAGPTSKVLAYDLTQIGYRALDLGHIAKSYDYYMCEVTITDDIERKFWEPDS